MDAFSEHAARSDAAHNCQSARPSQPFTNAINGFDAGAMCTQSIRNLEFLQLVRSNNSVAARSREKM
jgi:hypothetical protein